MSGVCSFFQHQQYPYLSTHLDLTVGYLDELYLQGMVFCPGFQISVSSQSMVEPTTPTRKRSEKDCKDDREGTKRQKKLSESISIIHEEISECVSLHERIEVLNKCTETWFSHERAHDHDEEIKSMIPNSLCLMLGYTLTMDAISVHSNKTSALYGQNSSNRMEVSQQLLVGKICEALYLMYHGCSNEARDMSFRSIGMDLLSLLVQVIQWYLHAAYERDLFILEDTPNCNVTIQRSIAILLAFCRTRYPRLTMSCDDNTLTALSKISSNTHIPYEIRLNATCVLSNIAYDCCASKLNETVMHKAKSFSQFISEISATDESYMGKAREYVEAALWNLSTSVLENAKKEDCDTKSNIDLEESNLYQFIGSLASSIHSEKNKLCIRRRGLRLLRCLSYGHSRTIMASHKALIKTLTNILIEDSEEYKIDQAVHCLCSEAVIDSSFKKMQIDESRLEAAECLSYVASAMETKSNDTEIHLVLNTLARVVCDRNKTGPERAMATKGLRSLAQLNENKIFLAEWPDFFDALVDICLQNFNTDNALVAAETLSIVASSMDASMSIYNNALNSITKVMSKGDIKCTVSAINVLLEHSTLPVNSKIISSNSQLLNCLARVAGDHNNSISIREKSTEIIKNLCLEMSNGERMANTAILSSLVKVASLGGSEYVTARHQAVQSLIYLSNLVSNRRLIATQIGLLTTLIRYLRSFPNCDLSKSLSSTIEKLTPAL